jgi:hypothetical protein
VNGPNFLKLDTGNGSIDSRTERTRRRAPFLRSRSVVKSVQHIRAIYSIKANVLACSSTPPCMKTTPFPSSTSLRRRRGFSKLTLLGEAPEPLNIITTPECVNTESGLVDTQEATAAYTVMYCDEER